jgi:hypothetical protein
MLLTCHLPSLERSLTSGLSGHKPSGNQPTVWRKLRPDDGMVSPIGPIETEGWLWFLPPVSNEYALWLLRLETALLVHLLGNPTNGRYS